MHVHIHTHTCIHIYMYTYTYTYTYIHTWIHIHTRTHIHVHVHIYIYICLCTHIHIYIYIYRICTSSREREANVYADVHNICLTYTPAHAWCATTPVNTCRLSQKYLWTCIYTYTYTHMHVHIHTHRESCANIVQAVVYYPPFRPPSCWQSVARRCPLKKSVQIHASS